MALGKEGFTPNIDDLDIKLIQFLQQDGRMAYAQLAKELDVSEATVHARLGKLEQHGIIKGFTVIIDPEKTGLTMMALILIRADPKKTQYVFSRLREMDEITELLDVTGDYYGVAKVLVRNHHELGRLLDKIGLLDGVVSTNTLIVLRKIKEDRTVRLRL
jgi:Lrp/AsnC family transcriptional regulator for asnA, asnC and gidA